MACPLLSLVVFLAVLVLQLLTYCKAALVSADPSVLPASSSSPQPKEDEPVWSVSYDPEKVELRMNSIGNVVVRISGFTQDDLRDEQSVQLRSERLHVVTVLNGGIGKVETKNGRLEARFNLSAVFLGSTNLYVEVNRRDNRTYTSTDRLPATVLRQERVIDKVFTASVAVLVSILYINFGAALDIPTLKKILVRPIGPLIGFFSQFLFMPLLSYGLGHVLFPDSFELQLGLFFTGVSPAGGASNIWTVVLGGNLNLSVAMTTLSTLAAFGMMPLWIFTLGHHIFERANLRVPYYNIATFAVGLIMPLLLGLIIQHKLPRSGRILVRILKPMSACLILFIVIFAIVTNLYLFELFSWQIIIAGLGLPWIGYVFGYLVSSAVRLPPADVLAIAIETGIQNTGIAIFLLKFSLPQPAADLTTVVPVAAAIMTPIPLLTLYVVMKVRERCSVRKVEMIPKDSSRHALSSAEST